MSDKRNAMPPSDVRMSDLEYGKKAFIVGISVLVCSLVFMVGMFVWLVIARGSIVNMVDDANRALHVLDPAWSCAQTPPSRCDELTQSQAWMCLYQTIYGPQGQPVFDLTVKRYQRVTRPEWCHNFWRNVTLDQLRKLNMLNGESLVCRIGSRVETTPRFVQRVLEMVTTSRPTKPALGKLEAVIGLDELGALAHVELPNFPRLKCQAFVDRQTPLNDMDECAEFMSTLVHALNYEFEGSLSFGVRGQSKLLSVVFD